MISNGNPEKSIIYAVQNKSEVCVNYYVSDEKKFSEIGERYKKEKWGEWKYDKKLVKIGYQLEEAVKPIFDMIEMDYIKGSYIVFKSCLYRIGGVYSKGGRNYKERKSVNKLDLKNMDLGWVKVADMNYERHHAYPVILDGELYVLGGFRGRYGLYNKDEETNVVLMEVLKSDGSAWETIPNPPLKDPYSKDIYSNVLAGTIKSKTMNRDIIIVAIENFNNYRDSIFELYTYEAGAREWIPYGKISPPKYVPNPYEERISYSCRKPGVVSGQLMLYLGDTYCNLFVMDLDKGEFNTIDLLQTFVIPSTDIPVLLGSREQFLVMIEEGKFCYFWTVPGPRTGRRKYSMLKACIFTIKSTALSVKRKRSCCCNCSCKNKRCKNKRDAYKVEVISRWVSLIPECNYETLEAVCVVDYIPDQVHGCPRLENYEEDDLIDWDDRRRDSPRDISKDRDDRKRDPPPRERSKGRDDRRRDPPPRERSKDRDDRRRDPSRDISDRKRDPHERSKEYEKRYENRREDEFPHKDRREGGKEYENRRHHTSYRDHSRRGEETYPEKRRRY